MKEIKHVVLVSVAFLGASVLLGHAQQRPPSPFSVQDDIAFTRIVASTQGTRDTTIQWSPDRLHFFVVTMSGDLLANSNIYRLICYNVRGLMPTPEELAPKVILSVATKTNVPGISLARWFSNSEISLLKNEDLGPTQLYLVDLESQGHNITRHLTSITDYAIADNKKDVIVEADKPLATVDEVSRGYIAGRKLQPWLYAVGMRFPLLTERECFHVDFDSGQEARLRVPTYVSLGVGFNSELHISQNGRWAVVPATNNNDSSDAPYSSPELYYPAYLLVDLQAAIRGLDKSWFNLELSSGQHSGVVEFDLAWSPDEKVMYVARHQSGDAPRAMESASLQLIELPSRVKVTVAELPRKDRISRVRASANDHVEVELSKEVISYAMVNKIWMKEEKTAQQDTPPLDIGVRQDLNEPPDLYVAGGHSGKTPQRISNLNPQMSRLALGDAGVFRWRGLDGREWTGALLKPISFQSGRRYPLVIQTHGYRPGTFWLNGSTPELTSGYAARALASRGLIVLQVPDDYSHMGTPAEIADNVGLIAGAVHALIQSGIVDPDRIGIHGSSRSGFIVQAALVTTEFDIAAASVAEGDEVSREEYTQGFGGISMSSMSGQESMYGVPPLFGELSARAWAERDPTNHLDRVKCPLLIQAYMDFVGEWWDTYAILRRNLRPVEYMYFPDAAHVPQKPIERLVAQGSVVDWYDFWLNNHADPDPAKVDQYGRWRELKKMQEENDNKTREQKSENAPRGD